MKRQTAASYYVTTSGLTCLWQTAQHSTHSDAAGSASVGLEGRTAPVPAEGWACLPACLPWIGHCYIQHEVVARYLPCCYGGQEVKTWYAQAGIRRRVGGWGGWGWGLVEKCRRRTGAVCT